MSGLYGLLWFYQGIKQDRQSELDTPTKQETALQVVILKHVISYLESVSDDKLIILKYSLIPTDRRLTFDILEQADRVTYKGDDDGPYFKFTASNGYEVISRSRMDIQTERLWLLGAKHPEETRSGSMVFSNNEKRDRAHIEFIKAIDEWAAYNSGKAWNLYPQV